MDALVLHTSTKEQLTQLLTQPSHAVLITGADGIGKGTLAHYIASELLRVASDKLTQYAYLQVITPDEKNTISIEAIRGLQSFLQLKTIGNESIRRVVIIEHADRLTTEAQNAYLKLLEEPPADTVMLLTVARVRSLLPTIQSRAQTLHITTPPEAALRSWFAATANDDTRLTQAYFLSGGLPGLMSALVGSDSEHPLLASISQAKDLLQMPLFERLAAVDALSKQKDTAKNIVAALLRIAQAGINQAAGKQDTARIKQWHKVRKAALQALQELERSANAKLVLTHFVLHM